MTVLGCDKTEYKKHFIHFFLPIIVVSVTVIVLNVLLAVFRTETTHIAFLVINILSDIAAVWYVIAAVTVGVIPKKKLLKFFERGEKSGKEKNVSVKEISDKSIVIQGFKCRTVTVYGDEGEAEIFLIEGGLQLEKERKYKIGLLEGIIYFAEAVK